MLPEKEDKFTAASPFHYRLTDGIQYSLVSARQGEGDILPSCILPLTGETKAVYFSQRFTPNSAVILFLTFTETWTFVLSVVGKTFIEIPLYTTISCFSLAVNLLQRHFLKNCLPLKYPPNPWPALPSVKAFSPFRLIGWHLRCGQHMLLKLSPRTWYCLMVLRCLSQHINLQMRNGLQKQHLRHWA